MEQRWQFADLVFTYKALNGHINCAPEDIGLFRSSSACTRGGSAKLTQRRAILKITESLNCIRVPSAWNKLPANVISSTSLVVNRSHINFGKSVKYSPGTRLYTKIFVYSLIPGLSLYRVWSPD